ncbi:hypothetical protein M404DRAFT_369647 [Pisolithus tinctorius Marx 270]|uniref:Uncharacterized protein n=1 Tax=Pisolithus tinctorius Marx 270 TaxID=870435 RepID=A0A0C3ICN1_PISTI|nr:hypothetical protein M404DRAFT_369647 [Pisolithus tinctorius Marx 270]
MRSVTAYRLAVFEVFLLQQPSIQNFSHVGHREVRPPPTQVNDMPEESKWRLPERASRLCLQGAMLRSYESIALDLQVLLTSQIVGIDAKKATKANICVVVPQVQLSSEQVYLVDA